MISPFEGNLFRADINLPPPQWSVDFKNPKYEFENSGYGAHKNTAGLFFFTDSKDDAEIIGYIEAGEASKDGFYLTSFAMSADVKIIDFSECSSIHGMLELLYSLGLDVLTDDFLTGEEQRCFSQVRDQYFKLIDENDRSDKNEYVNYMKKLIGLPDAIIHEPFRDESERIVSAFGQRLTDFNNGCAFKKLVMSSGLGVDGYRWKEGQFGFSYCFFESSKLPNVKTVEHISIKN